MGKGSAPRPYSVDQETFSNNWDTIFKQKPHEGQFDGRKVTDTANTSKTSEGELPTISSSGEME
jgi:hypothetical protein